MATIISSEVQCYTGTEAYAGHLVGRNGGKNVVARYSFTTDAVGASGVSWTLDRNSLGGGISQPLRWYITASSTSHINAGASTTIYHGDVTISTKDGWKVFSGSTDIVLLPNTTYYLWIFPATTTYGFWYLTEKQTATVETTGAVGLARIHEGGAFSAYRAIIHNGSMWGTYRPIIHNGSSWGSYS